MPVQFLTYYTGLEFPLALLHQAAFPEHEQWSVKAFKDLLHLPTSFLCVLFDDIKGLQGFLLYSKIIDEAEIITFAVHPVCQGQGLGKQILHAFLQKMKTQNINSIFLEVEETNERAYLLYSHNQFKVTAKRLDYYGKGKNAYLMRYSVE